MTQYLHVLTGSESSQLFLFGKVLAEKLSQKPPFFLVDLTKGVSLGKIYKPSVYENSDLLRFLPNISNIEDYTQFDRVIDFFNEVDSLLVFMPPGANLNPWLDISVKYLISQNIKLVFWHVCASDYSIDFKFYSDCFHFFVFTNTNQAIDLNLSLIGQLSEVPLVIPSLTLSPIDWEKFRSLSFSKALSPDSGIVISAQNRIRKFFNLLSLEVDLALASVIGQEQVLEEEEDEEIDPYDYG